jgi:transcriptional regulator with XRE-family HTH domain
MYKNAPEPRSILRDLMSERGFDQAALARASGVPQPTISRYLAGKHKHLSTEHLMAIAQSIGATVSELLGEVPIASAVVREAQRALACMSDDERARAVRVFQAMTAGHH